MNILKLSAYPTYLLSLLTCTVVLGAAVDVIIVEDTASPCSANEFKCAGSDVCIADCDDGSDEENCAVARKCSATEFQCTNRQCISSWRRCDGQYDCDDHSDETAPFCGAETCHPDHFQCENRTGACIPSEWRDCSSKEFECANGQCIRRAWLCDGYRDCLDGSDEDASTTCNTTACRGDEFPCGPAGGGCVPGKFRCDGYGDCTDGSDEKDCPVSGATSEFACNDGQRVPLWSCCDGYANCDDGSDETADVCHALGWCAGNELTCDSPERSCVPAAFACDGYEDCVGGSDERNCAGSACSSEEFACKNGQCVPKGSLCDGHLDCEDGSDEHRTICALNACRPDEFACKNPRGSCVSSALRCNGSVDCEDGSDEMGC
ncbi:hypothetical protein HPB49_020819 [Dermacentor silvarum]|uniref:Uncharacterized protein n=1 Tax=Dermacentor silvarum TaxID=543639 RepID=A0ACB8DR83_DERSI|nr:hypothetical protein HPB49_020819 [Dermacentor silvarum]